MSAQVQTGLDRLLREKSLQRTLERNLAYLCHSASIDQNLNEGICEISRLFGPRLKALFSPQHGLVSDVQDNMVETHHSIHPKLQIPIFSLYSETRRPTDEMLADIDTVIIDLQDVGTRVYTYLSTMTYMLEACSRLKIKVIILDRPNPAGGTLIEGNIIDPGFESFVGVLPIAMRHAMTMGELAYFAKDHLKLDVEIEVIKMKGWKREMNWRETGLTWVNPSPNLSHPDSATVYPGTVIFEGTNISEGRGTTRALEQLGHPKIKNYQLMTQIEKLLQLDMFQGIKVRPVSFLPTFQKFSGQSCQGHFLHALDVNRGKTWAFCQCLLSLYIQELQEQFSWKEDGYEYQFDRPAIDYINGNEILRKWAQESGELCDLVSLEQASIVDFVATRKKHLIY